jgi:hypothetical protein
MEVLRGRVQRRQRGAHGRAATCDVEGAGGKEDEWGFGGQVRLLAGVFEQRLLEAGSGQRMWRRARDREALALLQNGSDRTDIPDHVRLCESSSKHAFIMRLCGF